MSATLKSRIEKVIPILEKNVDLKEKTEVELTSILQHMGVDDSDIGIQILEAATTTFEDFEKAFISTSSNKCPTARLKFIWEMLKCNDPTKQKDDSSISDLTKILKPIGQWQDLELLEQYGKQCPDSITEELEKRSKKRFTIIFNDDGSVDAENSLYMLRKARVQETPSTFLIKNEMKQVYRVSDFPMDIFYECPIHSNILLVDGYCEECGTKWDITDKNKNVFIRFLISEVNDIRPYKKMAFEDLKAEFPKVFLKFKSLQEEDKLPSLKRKLSKTRDGDPFRVVNHKTF
jgi:hypothetical protein